MCVALLGGMDRLKPHYINEAEKSGIDIKVYERYTNGMRAKINHVDAVIIFTNKISHKAKQKVSALAKTRKIPVYMYHSCGVCTLRNCLNCLVRKELKTCQQ